MAKWKVGDQVRLKSGGPAMTVDSVTEAGSTQTGNQGQATITCKWSAGQQPKTGQFSEDSLA